MTVGDSVDRRQQLLAEARSLRWYHTLELAPDVVTDGWFDLRGYTDRYGLPERMDGLRALDVGTWDGFWAFEMESRGAEVVAIDLDDERDLDWPPRRIPERFPDRRRGRGFEIAKELRGSRVERHNLSVYDATPERLGRFDFILCASVVMHLRDQFGALERIADLCAGTFLSIEEYDPWVGLLPFPAARYLADRDKAVVFWLPSVRTWKRMLWSAGFDIVERRGRFRVRSTEGFSVRHVAFRCEKLGPRRAQAAASPGAGRRAPRRSGDARGRGLRRR
jgi:tRNA (mo5U34)-methyltransferase